MSDWREMPWVTTAFKVLGSLLIVVYIVTLIVFYKFGSLNYDNLTFVFGTLLLSSAVAGVFEYFNIISFSQKKLTPKLLATGIVAFIYFYSGIKASTLVNDMFSVNYTNLPNTKIVIQFIIFMSMSSAVCVAFGIILDKYYKKSIGYLGCFGRMGCILGILLVMLNIFFMPPFTPEYLKIAQSLDFNPNVSECGYGKENYESGIYIPSGKVLVLHKMYSGLVPLVIPCSEYSENPYSD